MAGSGGLQQEIPVYALYGEADALLAPRSVHAETISSRSLALDWRIAPHRHSTLYQALLVTEGHASASAEGRRVALPAGSLVWVPPLCVHAYDFAPGTVGIVVSIPAALMASGLALAPAVLERLGEFMALPGPLDPAEWEEASFLARTLLRDYQTMAAGREASLLARAALLALWTAGAAGRRERTPSGTPREGPMLGAVRRFLAMVEASYAEPKPLTDYARAVGVSMPHLNRVCRTLTGRSPLRLVQDRKLVEAKRLLTYTAMPVAQIAYRLGFEDAAYFSRFFRMRMGASPLGYRRLADAQDGTDNLGVMDRGPARSLP